MSSSDSASLAARLERMEAIDAIRQLASKYALAVDMRDTDALVGLYVEDVRATRDESGRQALKRVFDTALRVFTASVHHVGNHIIELSDADNADGLVYCRCEHEVLSKWVPMYLYYLDSYRRVDGRWYFRRRLNHILYAADMLERPIGARKVRWPGAVTQDGNWHDSFPSWQAFWADPKSGDKPVAPPAAADKFIDTMRRGASKPRSQGIGS
jgi:ketosteroid isomerase-like protein